MYEEEWDLTPIDDMLDRDRRRFGLNPWVAVGVLAVSLALFILGNWALKLIAALLGVGVPVSICLYTKDDPQRLVLFVVNRFLYSHYDSRKKPTKGYRLRKWLRP